MPAKALTVWIICFLTGAIIAPFFEVSIIYWLVLGLVLCSCSFLSFTKKPLWIIIFGLGLVFLSVFNFQSQQVVYKELNNFYSNKKVEVIGSISSLPIETKTGWKVELDSLSINQRQEEGKVLIYIKKYPEIDFADELKFSGKIKKYRQKENQLIRDHIIGEISVNKFDKTGQNNSIKYQIKGFLFHIRTSFNEVLQQTLPQKEAGLASGLILGEKTAMSAEFKRALQNSGTSHIIALSGYNITIILSLFVIFRTKLSRIWNLLLPLAFIIFFVIMTGASASIVRAGIMGFMPVLARYLGRNSHSFIAILVSALIMVFINPYVVLFDVGFQLSFSALCGMLYLGPIISKLFYMLPDSIRLILSETLGAQIVALPLLLYYFGTVSIISPISNLIILSLVPIGMLASFVIGVSGFVVPILAQFLAVPGYILLHLFYLLINFFGSLPFASTQLKINNPLWLVLAYLLLLDIMLIDRQNNLRIKVINEKILQENN